MSRTPHVLLILDGFGHREAVESNAIAAAQMPNWQALLQNHPHGLISGSGLDVGLPDDQMGNSEVGHMNLGAGRVVYQDFTRINQAVANGDFFKNEVILAAVDRARARDGRVHVMGLLSPGGVHAHESHLQAMVSLAHERGAREVIVHAFLDGRDTPPKSADASLRAMSAHCAKLGRARIGSVVGRYYAMDRDNRWDRVEAAYALMVRGQAARTCASAEAALAAAYADGQSDEFVTPSLIVPEGASPALIRPGDAVVFMNFRADRAREITRAFVDETLTTFERGPRLDLADFVMLTAYADGLDARVAYAPDRLSNSLGEYLSGLGKTQLRIAETEKYAHVTFFFSAGREQPYAGETRILVPSPDVATYDLQPEMSAAEVTDRLVAAIASGEYDLLVCNYANGDMVGHTGVFEAAVKACETLDASVARVVQAVQAAGGELLITADHGNVEQMSDAASGQAHTAHTCEPVPLVYVGQRSSVQIRSGGILSDVAPTMLDLMNLPCPAEMTGRSLLSPVAR